MINLEFYKDEIIECLKSDLDNPRKLHEKFKYKINFGESYIEKFVDWLLEEYKCKTYKDDFFEKFPNATAGDEEYPKIDWCELYNDGKCSNWHCQTSEDCFECWDKEMEKE